AGVDLALEMGAKHLELRTDSQLVVTQIKGEAQAKEQYIQKYLAVFKRNVERLETFKSTHIPRDKNTKADILAHLAVLQVSPTLSYRRRWNNQVSWKQNPYIHLNRHGNNKLDGSDKELHHQW
ncbi:ribonuclease H protein, partial [Trifolium medium]|nr:ribonuclease H protein [Trifolium medium]